MAQKYANAARAELAATINDTDLALEIVTGGELFPVADTGSSAISAAADWFKLTLQDDAGYEIVFVRTHTSGSVNFTNILRGQEGTTAREFLAGSVVGLRPTAGDAESYAISDDPSDGKTYGRKDAGWAETVTPADTQTLTNKTLTSPIFNDGYTEEVFAVTGTTPALSPTNGSIQTWVLSGNSTPTAGTWVSGQSMTLMVDDGSAYPVNWASMSITWKTGGGTAPALLTTDYTPIELTKIGTTIYGWLAGDA